MSLPSLLSYRPDRMQSEVPYLFADPTYSVHWEATLRGPTSSSTRRLFLVGVNWQGDPTFAADSFRSVPLTCFTTIAQIPSVRLVSLQKGHGTEQLGPFPFSERMICAPHDLDADCGAFQETAPLMQRLDLVITTDTAIAHLAGALGLPTWIALGHVPDWRWLLTGSNCPWHPTVCLFRQPASGDWQSVFGDMARQLTTLAKQLDSRD